MSDAFPRWPSAWLEDHAVSAEQVLARTDEVECITALRTDEHVLFSISWPEGRRYLLVDPEGEDPPASYKIGERSEDPEVSRVVEGVWSEVLKLAKQIIDGELEMPGRPPAG